jgi:hypothetical protein
MAALFVTPSVFLLAFVQRVLRKKPRRSSISAIYSHSRDEKKAKLEYD